MEQKIKTMVNKQVQSARSEIFGSFFAAQNFLKMKNSPDKTQNPDSFIKTLFPHIAP